MTADRELTGSFDHVNPFPPAAVSRLAELESGSVPIETEAVHKCLRYTDQYLVTTGEAGTRGNGSVLAVIGEYGAGKTFIANEILRHLAERTDLGETTVHRLSLDAPAASFLALYRERFIVRLTRQEVRAQVLEYYSDIVADSFGDSDLAAGLVLMLRNRSIDPTEIVDRLGLMENRFLQELRHQLQDVTENEAFGTALSLFIRPQFEAAVWEWLTGHPPDSTLTERGIDQQISTDSTALEAMGIFAFLYGRKNHRFVVVIDDLEKILAPASGLNDDLVLAFRKLLEIYTSTGGLLVLCGLTEVLQVLPADARTRITWTVKPGPLTQAQAGEYIERTLRPPGRPALHNPFDEGVVRYMVALTGGTPRPFVRLCHRLYRDWMSAPDQPISDAIVRAGIREQQTVTLEEIRGEIRRALDSQGWIYEQGGDWPGASGGNLAYWIPRGTESGGCAILLSASVLQSAEAAGLVQQAAAIRDGNSYRRVVLVVGDHLAENLRREVDGAFDAPPLTYHPRRFNADVVALVSGMLHGVERAIGGDSLDIVQGRIDQIGRQLTQTQSYVEQLVSRVEVMRSTSDRQFLDLRRDLEQTLRTAAQPQAEPGRNTRVFGAPLPERVQRHFDRAFEALNAIEGADVLVRSTFQADPLNAQSLSFRLRYPDTQEAVGVAVLLRCLVESFRDSVADWLAALQDRRAPDQKDRRRLETLCSMFDNTYAILPINRLDRLPGLVGDAPVGDPPAFTWISQRASLREALEPLSRRVLNSALEAAQSD